MSASVRMDAFVACFGNGRSWRTTTVAPSTAFWRIALVRCVRRSGGVRPKREFQSSVDHPCDVLQGLRPQIGDLKFETRLDLPVRVLGQANPARLANPLKRHSPRHPSGRRRSPPQRRRDECRSETRCGARAGGRALRSTMALWTSIAQRTASTTLRNSMMLPSPVCLTTRPRWAAMAGATTSLRTPRRRVSVRSSSAPASRL